MWLMFVGMFTMFGLVGTLKPSFQLDLLGWEFSKWQKRSFQIFCFLVFAGCILVFLREYNKHFP